VGGEIVAGLSVKSINLKGRDGLGELSSFVKKKKRSYVLGGGTVGPEKGGAFGGNTAEKSQGGKKGSLPTPSHGFVARGKKVPAGEKRRKKVKFRQVLMQWGRYGKKAYPDAAKRKVGPRQHFDYVEQDYQCCKERDLHHQQPQNKSREALGAWTLNTPWWEDAVVVRAG